MTIRSTDHETIAGLKPRQRAVLDQIWRTFAGTGFDDGKLRALQVQRMSGAEVRAVFAELRQLGWVQAVIKAWGERLYYIPFDRLVQLASLYGGLADRPDLTSSVSLIQEGRAGIATDLFNALVYASLHELSLTAKGVLHKKHIQRLSQVLSLSSDDVRGLELPYEHIEAYPPHVAVMLDLLLALGLLRLDTEALVLHRPSLDAWLKLPRAAMEKRLLQCLMQRYMKSEPEFQHAAWLLCSPRLAAGVWHADTQLLQQLEEKRLLPEANRSRLLQALKAWLQLLSGAGWLDLGENERGDTLFRWRMRTGAQLLAEDIPWMEAEGEPATLIVQPDFEVLIPPDTPYTVRYTAARLAERVADDHMSVYRLSREALAMAADADLSPGQAISFLEAHAAGGIPDNVAAALRQWSAEIGRTAFMELTVLACTTSDEADLIENHPRLKDDIKRLGPLYFAVQADKVSDIRKLLTAAGLPPRRGMATLETMEQAAGMAHMSPISPPVPAVTDKYGSEAVKAGNERADDRPSAPSSGLIRMSHPALLYRPDEAELKEDNSPDLAQLPVMWTRDYRAYHLSTAKQIMEQAVQLALKVEISLEGKRREFIPVQLLRSPWRVAGVLYEPDADSPGADVQLGEGQWQEMRLIVP
ncbi:helicase-associated domain-containing protein [Paenibacillus campinasensis]|uniref:Helicase XPB/Ssl2 N-terminal domain-containing protein n=1 Tax=Paenibacillus campinasensis TaxID=66347 RepID=A0A268F3V0_9BACL|nr:helicase-associated domain-containing protein [Paenibacillus campinasensis]PAD80057.1 hypothetical protein CHH67_01970 [Paenibacillus campinasensis]